MEARSPEQPPRIVLLGAGRLASHLAHALLRHPEAGTLVQLYSRSRASVERLSSELAELYDTRGLALTTELTELLPEADIYLFVLSDDALPELWRQLEGRTRGLWVHCSGATSLGRLLEYHPQGAVLYPLQTFSRERAAAGSYLPFYIEGSDTASLAGVRRLAELLGDEVHEATSAQRLYLHLGAVLACNFSNYLVLEAEHLLEREGLPPKALLPLLDELLAKLHTLPAREALTGPAARGDEATMQRHEELLTGEPELQQLYRLLSERIQQRLRS
ncbi:Rossmann-like and DUF2520 domain-containing protein [Porphyromonas sp.]